jgi:hypothetical protein
MKRIALHNWFLLVFFLCVYSFSSFSQDITGIWKGYFTSNLDGQYYRLEFQLLKTNNSYTITGVSYSYLDKRFYGKATMTGSYLNQSQMLKIKEIRTVEVKSLLGGTTCIMNYKLKYSRSGKEEFLEGDYLGKNENPSIMDSSYWGDCSGGKVSLRRVMTSDFYIEPFLRKKNTAITPPVTDSVVKTTPLPVIKKPPVVVKTNPIKKPVIKPATKPVTKTNPPVKQKTDSTVKIDIPLVKNPVKPAINTPAILKERTNELMKSLVVNDQDVTVRLYDNGEIDGDSISIFYDKKLLLTHQRLGTSPITVKLKIDDENEVHELVMVAENLGRIPPNTALMIVDAGDQRFDVRITSTEQKNALVRFRYERPK